MKQVFAGLAILASGLSATSLNSTEIDSMVKNACNGDQMCIDLMNELDLLDLERSTTDRANFLRRLKQLKALILHLQPAHHFARYCFYGCWCLPDAEHTVEGVGFGQPIDEVDASCKRQASCYECAKMDHQGRNCVADQVQYNYQLNVGADNWGNSIECLDEPNSGKNGGWSEKFSCRRAICECDKKLAEDLREHFHVWTHENHQGQGDFNPVAQCLKSPGNGAGFDGTPECCGEYPNRFPYKTNQGSRMCCGDKTYDSSLFECCASGNIAAIGAC